MNGGIARALRRRPGVGSTANRRIWFRLYFGIASVIAGLALILAGLIK
ncbi:MAG: hypothetical protein ACYC21_02015 [Eubacteriales bacterium]